MTDLDELKKKKLQQLQQQAAQQNAQPQQVAAAQQQQEQIREQVKKIAAQCFTQEARDRLNNIRHVKPDLAFQLEMYIVQLSNSGQLRDKITDEILKDLLRKVQDGQKRERKIKFR